MKVFLRKSSKIKRTEERKRKKKKAPLGSNKGLLVGIKASRTLEEGSRTSCPISPTEHLALLCLHWRHGDIGAVPHWLLTCAFLCRFFWLVTDLRVSGVIFARLKGKRMCETGG